MGGGEGAAGGDQARGARSRPPPPGPGRRAAATTAQPASGSPLEEEGIPGLPTPRPHAPPSPRAGPALTPGPAPHAGPGGGGYLRARSPAHRNSRRARPGSSDPAFRRRRRRRRARPFGGRVGPPAVAVCCETESLIPTQHGGGARGGFPRRLRLRGREEAAFLHAESRPTAPPPRSRTPRLPREMEWAARPLAFSRPFAPLCVVPRALFSWGRTREFGGLALGSSVLGFRTLCRG